MSVTPAWHVRRLRILLTARDAASSGAMRVIGQSLVSDGRFEVFLVTQEPASTLMMWSMEMPHRHICVGAIREKAELVSCARNLISDFSPDIILTGISGLGFGIDEAILEVAPRSKFGPYALQSYWGDVNESCSQFANTYLVIDNLAGRLTAKRTGKRVITVGSVKHFSYTELDTLKLRYQFKLSLGLNFNKFVIGVFGQPFEMPHPYYDMMSAFAQACGVANLADSLLVYRPHPKESTLQTQWIKTQFSSRTIPIHLNLDQFPESFLCGCDYVVSAFSTCGYDLQHLIHVSKTPLGAPVYLAFNSDFVSWWKSQTFLTKIPMSDQGMAIVINSLDQLPSLFDYSLMRLNGENCWKSVRDHFPSRTDSAARIIQALIEDQQCTDCENK